VTATPFSSPFGDQQPSIDASVHVIVLTLQEMEGRNAKGEQRPFEGEFLEVGGLFNFMNFRVLLERLVRLSRDGLRGRLLFFQVQ